MDKLIPRHQLLFKLLRNIKILTSLCLLNHQKKYGHETAIQTNSEGGKGETVHSGTTSKTFEQNTVAILIDTYNVTHDVKGKGKYSQSLDKPVKQNNVIIPEKKMTKRNQLRNHLKIKRSVQSQGSKTLSKV